VIELAITMTKSLHFLAIALFCGFAAGPLAQAQKAEADGPPTKEAIEKRRQEMVAHIEKFGWTREGAGKLGKMAEVAIPHGYRFTSASGTQQMLRMFDNFPSNNELGMLTTEGLGPWIIFEFNEVGYVKDDDKDALDADKLMETLRAGQEAGNERRREMGIGELELLGWALPPRYNPQTHNLEWATRIRSKDGGGESINYNTRLLGRKGVMEVALVCAPDEMDKLMPEYQNIMAGYKYVSGESYAEYRAGDKVAQYGLAALVAGGAAVAAGKMGLFGKLGVLFAKLGKGIFVVIIAVAAVLKSLLARLFGRKSPEA
jgi:uncharacterized membrane-anchored protein